MINRDELAARVLVAFAGGPDDPITNTEAADVAVKWADALIARLRPATVAPAATRPEDPVRGDSPRSEWVRITGPADVNTKYVTIGKAYRVNKWDKTGHPWITTDHEVTPGQRVEWSLAKKGDCLESTWPGWEPCAAPSPAASPAAYVPKVGDVVHGMYVDDTLARITYVAPNGTTGRATGFGRNQIPDSFVAFTTDLRPATAAERAAAGLDAPAVDREGLIAHFNACREEWWDDADDRRKEAEVYADAAIAFLKANGGVA